MRRSYTVLIAAAVVITIQIGCTWWLTRELRRNYAANVVETFKACKGALNPWEPYPWKR